MKPRQPRTRIAAAPTDMPTSRARLLLGGRTLGGAELGGIETVVGEPVRLAERAGMGTMSSSTPSSKVAWKIEKFERS